MPHSPSISVIIPVFNRAQYIAEAIASVLSQTIPPQEVIVVDDGSTDDSAQIIAQFPEVQYHYQTNQGAAAARNHGVTIAQGDFLAFLDSDDLWLSQKLEQELSAFRCNPQLDIVFSHVQQFYSPELSAQAKKNIHIPVEILGGCHVGAMLVQREAFTQVGAFNSALSTGETVDWLSRANDLRLNIEILPNINLRRRLHKTNQGSQHKASRVDYVKVVKAHLDRLRDQANAR